MPASPYPRIPIQTFTKAELDEADLCARALWYGINFETGKSITSDEWLLNAFATPFYDIATTNTYNGVSDVEVKKLVIACKLNATFRHTNAQHYLSGISVIASKIYWIYSNMLTGIWNLSSEEYGSYAVKVLSDALALRYTPFYITLQHI